MPFFKKAIVEEVPPTFYETTIDHLNSAVSSIEKHVPTPDQVQPYLDKFVENRVFLLMALFVLLTIVLCVPSTKKEEEKQQREDKNQQLEELLNIKKDEISELTATSSSSGASNEDSESDDDDVDEFVDDDASVEHTHNEFVDVLESKHEQIADDDDDSDAAVAQQENPASSPPTSDDERSTTSSIRSNFKKKMSFKKFSSRSFRRSAKDSTQASKTIQVNMHPRFVPYFEVTIMKQPQDSAASPQESKDEDVQTYHKCVAIGLSTQAFASQDRMPGWDVKTYGYHSDDGKMFSGGKSHHDGPSFGAGDTVGCGLECSTGKIFFTKNGKYLDYEFENIEKNDIDEGLYPTVAVDSKRPISVNYGEHPFKFDLKRLS